MRHLGLTIAMAAMSAVMAGCGQGGGGSPPATPPPPPLTDAQKQVLLAELPAPYSTGDLANGEAKFAMCRSCHTTAKGGANTTGPNLHGIFGSKVGEVPNFKFSDALLATGITWDAAKMDAWIASPRTMVPGTKMSYAGLNNPKDRIDLVAYLKVQTSEAPQ